MRLSLILGFCIVLCAAMVAQGAATLPTFGSGNIQDGDFGYTRTPVTVNGTSLDSIRIYFNLNPTGTDTESLQVLEGTWTVMGGSAKIGTYTYYDIDDNVQTDWPKGTTNLFTSAFNIPNGYSFVNFDAKATLADWARAHVSGDYYTSLEGSWHSDNTPLAAGAGTAGGQVARFWVTPGADLSFIGHWNQAPGQIPGGYGFTHSVTTSGGFSTAIPEPSTLLLAASGLIGLLCYAWRKRR